MNTKKIEQAEKAIKFLDKAIALKKEAVLCGWSTATLEKKIEEAFADTF
jgi:hypothetical protein